MADTRALVDSFRTDIYPHIAPWLAEAVSLLSGDYELRVADQNNARRYDLWRVHMGATMYVCRIDGTAVGKLLSREKSADEYFSECHRVGGSEHDNEAGENVWIDLDKAWFAIHSLLTEGREDRALPTGALLGGTAVSEQGCPAWLVLTVEQTASFAAYLAAKPDDMVERSPHFAAAVPEAWNNPQMMQYVAEHFRILRRFVTLAAAKGDGLMTTISA